MTQTDWTDGYYVGAEYTSGYYPHLAHGHLRFVCQASGLRCRIPEHPTYLELGCGRGVSVNIHAAAHPGAFWGVDFHPAHTAHARELAEASGADVILSEEAFADFAARADLPVFDVIVLHGVWSWISAANRAVILDLIRRRLAPGGVVYVSYNCQPGWAQLAPVRQLLTLGRQQRIVGGERGADEVDRAVDFLQEVVATNPRFFADNRRAGTHASGLAKKGRPYLAHEYLNADWHIPYFSEVAEEAARAKLTFVGSARVMDRVNDLNLTPEGVALLDRLKPFELREAVRDYLVDQRFRPDVYVKGASRMTVAEQERFWSDQPFMLITPREEIEFVAGGALGEAQLPMEVYGPVADALAADGYRPKTLDEVVALAGLPSLRRMDAVSAFTVLVGMDVLRPDRAAPADAVERSAAYNRHVLERALIGPYLKHLAAPAIGAGIPCSRPAQLFLKAWFDGGRDAAALAAGAWAVFLVTRERAVKNDQEMVTPEDNLAVLAEMAESFIARWIPLYQALGVVS